MRLPALLISDLHLTSKPRDEYRWGLFAWLAETVERFKIKTVVILGDVTDAKDFHGAELVNRVVSEIATLSQLVHEVIILKGNHDYLKENSIPFFNFLGMFPRIRFMSNISETNGGDVSCLFLPHCKNPHAEWHGLEFDSYDFVLMHQTVNASIASNGQKMLGDLAGDFDRGPLLQIYSGDIHVPQDVSSVRYVGSPYHVHFGDNFTPRCIVLDSESQEQSIYFKTIKRVTLTGDVNELEHTITLLNHGDQVKLRVSLEPSDRAAWDRIKKHLANFCEIARAEVHGIEMVSKEERRILPHHADKVSSQSNAADTVTQFVKREELGGDVLDTGLDIVQR